MAGLSADDLGLLEDAQDADDEKPSPSYRAPAPKKARASADDIAMFGPTKDATAPKPEVKTGGASADDIAMFGPAETTGDSPDWLTKKPAAHSLDSLSADIQRGKEALAKPTTLERIDNGLSSMVSGAGNVATLGMYDTVRSGLNRAVGMDTPLAQEHAFREEHPRLDAAGKAIGYLSPVGAPAMIGRTVATGLGAATKAAPAVARALLAARPVEGAIGGAATNAATTGAEDLANGVPLSEIPGHMGESAKVGAVFGGGMAALPSVARGGATVAEKLAARSGENQVGRSFERTTEGGTRGTRGRLESAEEKLKEVFRENSAVKAAAMKGDAALSNMAETVGKRGREELAQIYQEANQPRTGEPAAPREHVLTDQDILDAEAVPERIDTKSEPKTARIENPNFPTRRASPDVGATVPVGRARVTEGVLPGETIAAGEPVVGESESLLASAKAAEAEAAKLTAKAERYGRQADGFVNQELSAKAAKRASLYEIRADEARTRAEALHAQAAEAKARETAPTEAPAEAPGEGSVEEPAASGAKPADAVSNLDRSIARLSKGNTDEIAIAEQLKTMRDTYANSTRGSAETVPVEQLREQQSVFQRHGYGKAIKGQKGYAEESARIEAARQASKDIGDVVVKQVTGMDYEAAKAAAKADPESVAGRLFKANRDVEVSNLIQAHLDAKSGQVPNRHMLTKIVHGLAGAAGIGAYHIPVVGPYVAPIIQAAHAVHTVAPYVSRAADAAIVNAAPVARRLANSMTTPNPAAIARLIQASRAGMPSAQVRKLAEDEGIDPRSLGQLAGP